MPNALQSVVAHVKSKEVDWGLVSPHPSSNGHVYKIPIYEMHVSGLGPVVTPLAKTFNVIRFGVKLSSQSEKPTVVGLAKQQVHILNRVPYMNGSWQLYGDFLIHDGANAPKKSAWGQMGCIEVVGKVGNRDAWHVFEELVLALSGATTPEELGRSGKFSVTLDAVAERPPLVEYA